MKRWITLLMALVLCVTPLFACAESDLRHEVKGDVSSFEVKEDEGTSRAEWNEEQNGATLGTEIYLIVEDDTSSYVTFHVTDEQDRPIEGALVYITYNGISELYGVTDAQGKCSMYLFRLVEYGYRVEKPGYETAQGHFTAEEETREVRAVLRKCHELTICVVDGEQCQPGVSVSINGSVYTTDDEGKVMLRVPDGEYDGVVITADGRRIPFKAIVDGDTVIVVDIARETGERFLVYNKLYQPEDYVLTRYLFAPQDVIRLSGETDEEHTLRVERYLTANPGVILVQAQPEKKQMEPEDRVVLGKGDAPLYTQRSCMPMGSLLRAWEKEARTLIFTNEETGILLPLQALHSGRMAKLFALMKALDGGSVRSIATEETLKAWHGLEQAGLADLNAENLDVTAIDWDAIVPFAFEFDETESAEKILDPTVFHHARFEFRITPILPDALLDAVFAGLAEKSPMERDVIMLTSKGHFIEEMRRWQADGRLTDTECDMLFHAMTDGVLTADELVELRRMAKEGSLGRDAAEQLVNTAVDGRMYRVSCWVISGNMQVDCTALIDGMQVVWPSNERYAACYDEQLRMLTKETSLTEEQAAQQYAAQLEEQTLQAMERDYSMRTAELSAGAQAYQVSALRELPAMDDEFRDVLTALRFERLTVDVRRESTVINGENTARFHARTKAGRASLQEHYALAAQACVSGLAWLDAAE